ncbi:MAG: helix-turn-helix domain-containing protein [Solirubrobacterales bacterium]
MPISPQRLPRGRHGLSPSYVADNQRARILVGVAEVVADKGYTAMSVEDIVRRSGVSRRTFYDQFRDKRSAFFASFDAINEQVLAATTTAFASTDDWPEQVRRGLATLLGLLATEPAFARMAFLEMAMAGPDGLRRLEASIAGFQTLLGPGEAIAEYPVPAEVPHMIGSAIAELVRRYVVRDDVTSVSRSLPAAVYLCLVPYLGPSRAWTESQATA